MTQKVLHMTSYTGSLRSEVHGWGGEDSALYNVEKGVSFTPSMRIPLYSSPLAAMHDGWRLLGPPIQEADQCVVWWFVKD